MPGELQPLASNFAIVDADGKPNQYFIRWAQQRQIDIADGITIEQAQALIDDWAAARDVIAGSGLTGGGALASDITLNVGAGTGIGVAADDVHLLDTAVTPGLYGDATHVPQITIDQQGRIILAASVAISGGGGGGGGGSGGSVAAFAHFTYSGAGTVVTLNSTNNIASVVRNSIGHYRVNFVTPLPSANYSISGSGQFTAFADTNWISIGPDRQGSQTAAYCDVILSERYNGNSVDAINYCSISIINAVSGGGGGSTTPSLVQVKSAIGATSAVTLAAAPTAGNLLIALATHWNTLSVTAYANAGWTPIDITNGTTTDGYLIAMKYAVPGESATQTPFAAFGSGSTSIFEISGALVAIPVCRNTLKEITASPMVLPLASPKTGSLLIGMSCEAGSSTAFTLASGVPLTTLENITGATASNGPRRTQTYTSPSVALATAATVTTTFTPGNMVGLSIMLVGS